MERKKVDVPVWHKITLSYSEASALSGIGEHRMRMLTKREPNLCVCIDSHTRIKRAELEKYIDKANNI